MEKYQHEKKPLNSNTHWKSFAVMRMQAISPPHPICPAVQLGARPKPKHYPKHIMPLPRGWKPRKVLSA